MIATEVLEKPVHFESASYNSGGEFMSAKRDLAILIKQRRERELALAEFGAAIKYPGYCAVCRKETYFNCGWDIYRTLPDGRKEPSWRERLVCVECGLSNRLRASFHFMESECGLTPNSNIYLTEQTTPFYELVSSRCRNTTGSEYLRDGTAKGAENKLGLRHEDVTDLSFETASFDLVGSFEVLEHVPDYHAAISEIARVTKPGGHFIASFPFRMDLIDTLVRARVKPGGEIEHILDPEYHGDPLSADGVLCFYHFGWDILDTMRDAGFSEARCHFYWSWELGYLGGALPLFHAVR